MKIRVGQGVDVHAFGPGDHVMLGGVRIPHDKGLQAHSDGDVALHALCDAMLGAAALGDIGRHFPPTDDRWAGANSRDLLQEVNLLLRHDGWSVVNVDLTLVCEQPRITPHAQHMQANIAADLDLDDSDVSVKATTTEGLGFSGRGEGITALAIVLIKSW
ncbi:MAG: 2-C-methyl-D-erythritol 2,4-cyclodiphosphate synthase [Gammaproteobacteria bacterium]|nr:2-C-methyl-D-erythritol 2,4-cyclodiphosphate synthase [Gammaproteobacteria bacterium]NNK99071.1 2-C-methyl-D-erythritol 2,4-cyclodiphosphate synthase [Xanthomonadales bacterium]